MQRFLLLILLLVSGLVKAQDPMIHFYAIVNDDDLGKKLAGATIEILQDGRAFETTTTASNGKCPIVDLPINHTYTIYIKKEGFVTKQVYIDATYKYPEDLPKDLYRDMEVSIFKKVDGVDFAFLETTPMAKFTIDEAGYVNHDQSYSNEMLKRIEALKKQMEQQRLENEKKEAEEKKRQEDYAAYMKAGNDAMTTEKYDVAITQFESALRVIPGDPTAQAKLDEAKKKKADKEKADADAKAYAAKLEQAKIAYTGKKYEEALALYKECLAIKPTDTYVQGQIALIEQELNKQKEQADQFNKLVAEGDVAMNSKLYDDAITKYTAALAIKADPAVQAKLEQAKKLKLEKEQAEAKEKELEAKYQTLMKEADAAFNTQNYTVARQKYTEALGVKQADPTATAQIAKIDEILKKQQEEKDAAQKLEADYKKLMTEGETFITQKNWASAKQKFEAALVLKPNDPTALAKIDICNKELEKQSLETQKNEEYNRYMTEAKALFDQKKYLEAKQKYQQASDVKPDQADPKNQIIAIEKILADQQKAEQLEKDYQAFMKEGDDLKNIKDYTAAIDRYTKALALKPGDPAATQKINDIKKIQEDEQKQAMLEQQYKDFMAKADQYFNAKDYTNAKMYYQKAYELKQDPAIQTKIKEIDDLIAKTQNEQQLQAKYDAAIKEADALYKAGNLEGALAKYEEASAIKSSETYPQQKISEIKQKLQTQKEQAEKEQQFKDFVAAGDAAYNSKDYQKALASYQEAIKIKPDPAISQKIGQLNTLISQQSEQEQLEQRYKSKIGEADAAFNSKSWESARELYREALMIKQNDTYATNQIAEIEKQMKLETDAEVEANYQKIIQKADNLKNEDRLDEALVYYNNALKLKPTDPYPKQMIDEINRIKTERQNTQQEQQKLENEYNALIKEADIAFNSQNWTVALAKYKEALLKKPGEPYPQGRISEINTKINEQNQVQQQDTEYNKYISQADALFNQGKYLESITVYQQALGVKPNDAYATNQIQEAERREKEKSVDEAEQEYQKILTAAQKKFDEGDYLKALDYYKRALTMKPGDTYVQKRIAEINQLLDNQKSQSEFDKYVLQANTYFEKSQWKEAKEYYLKALDIKDDKYCRDQIAIIDKNMQQQSTSEIEAEYQKIIKKADEYFAAKNYTKAKSLYERALSLKPSDPYPKAKLDELVCLIDPKRCVQDSNPLPDYGDPVNTTEVDIEAQLLEADDQRQFMINQKVEQQRVSAEDENTTNSVEQTNESFETTGAANQINQDLEEKEWSAEVHRTEANLEVIDMQITLEEEEYDRGTTNNNDVQLTNQSVTNINIEIEERNDEDDHPREEYLADVERIKVENEYEERSNTNDQTNEVHEGTDYVEVMQIENITNDPNNDVERKNTEVYVEDLNVVLINENNQNSWSQEDEVMGVKENTEVLVDERIAENVNNDIPREESAEELSDYTLDKENSDRNISNDQYDVTFDSKTYEEKMSIDIEMNNMDNDIPRQETEEKVEDTELLIEEKISDESNDQNSVVNTSDDKLDNLEIVIEEQNAGNDQPRQDYEENVVEIDLELQDYKDNLSELNEDNSHVTKDNTETLTDQKANFDTQADNKATMNSDQTNDAVEDIVEENKTISDGNNEEVAVTEDYIEEVKHEEPVQDNPPMKNELGEKYPEGVTEEVYAINDENGLLSKYIVRRIVVINGTGYNYEKVQTRYGTITYSRDGQPISEYQWQDETEAATLTRN